MFNSYIYLDYEDSKGKYCLSTFSAEKMFADPFQFLQDSNPNSTNLTLHNTVENDVTAKQLFTFIDGQIISVFTGEPISVTNSPTDQLKKWKLMPDGQIRTLDNYCISVVQKVKSNIKYVTLLKPITNTKNMKEKVFQKWRIVTKFTK